MGTPAIGGNFNYDNYFYIGSRYYNKQSVVVVNPHKEEKDEEKTQPVTVAGKKFDIPVRILKELNWTVKKFDDKERLLITNKTPFQVAKWLFPSDAPDMPAQLRKQAEKISAPLNGPGVAQIYVRTVVFSMSFEIKKSAPDKVTVCYYNDVKDDRGTDKEHKEIDSVLGTYDTPYSEDLVARHLERILILKK